VLAIFAAIGAAALITTWPLLYTALRWGGVLFLLFLAWEAWIGEKDDANAVEPGRQFRRGLIVNLLNPKAAAVFIVMIPGFAGSDAPAGALIAMTLTYLAIATLAHVLIVAFAGSFERALADPRRERIVRRIFALALAGVAIWFTFGTART
jgi:threonine/homoserine/homoserine lactone efflux protein